MKKLAALLIAAAMATGIATVYADRVVPAPDLAHEDSALKDLSRATQELHTRISGAFVRVKIENNLNALLNENLRKEFEQWREQQMRENPGQGGPGGPGREGPRDGARFGGREGKEPRGGDRPEPPQRGDGMRRPPRPEGEGPATQPGNNMRERMMNAWMLRRFLETGVAAGRWDADTNNRAQAIMQRLDGLRAGMMGELTGIIIDNEGHALIGTTLLRDSSTIKVVNADGTESAATVVGSHGGRPMTIIKLDSLGEATPLSIAKTRAATGAVLLALDAHNGAMSFVVVPGKPIRKGQQHKTDDRFPLFGDERGPILLFNTDGQLAALGSDRMAVGGETLDREVQFIIKNKKDITPRQFGVKYAPIPPSSELRKTGKLGDRPAVLVESVVAGSPAEKAKLQKGDIVLSIDKQPIWRLPQIMNDLATREGTVPLGILRNDQELTLDMPLN